MVMVDQGSIVAAAAIAVMAAGPGVSSFDDIPWPQLLALAVLTTPLFWLLGFYRPVVRFLRSQILLSLVTGVTLLAASLLVIEALVPLTAFPVGAIVTFWAFALLHVAGSRFLVRDLLHRSNRDRERAIIYGAGVTGARLADVLFSSGKHTPVAFIDDAESLHGSFVAGVRVYPSSELLSLVDEHDASLVLLAMPSASRQQRAKILSRLEQESLRVLSVPDWHDLISGKARFDDLREIDAADLLGRDPVPPDQELIEACVRDRSVMVTGAGGSIGAELCRQVLKLNPRRLVLLDHAEPALYAIDQELRNAADAATTPDIVPILASVTESPILEQTFRSFGVQTVFHAAAYKHVPLVEYNMAAGVRNNVLGTLRTAETAERAGVTNFVLVSTDKAVNPTNVMGATKRFSEMILQGFVDRGTTMRICMVRFGNVLDSSGSVVPLFRQQVSDGGPVTVTHPEITRYFMTIPEAAQLVIQAGAMGSRGEVFLLDMGEPVKISDLARRIIHLAGLVVRDADHPDGDIEIVYTGLRPAEKLYEELLISGNAEGTKHPRIWKAQESCRPWPEVKAAIDVIDQAINTNDCEAIRRILLGLVRGYTPPATLVDHVHAAMRRVETGSERKIIEMPKRS